MNNKINLLKSGISLLVLVLIIFACGDSKNSKTSSENESSYLTSQGTNTTVNDTYTLTEEQKEFYEKRIFYRDAYKKVAEDKNVELRQNVFRNCGKYTGDFFSSRDFKIENWIGKISKIHFSDDGKYGGITITSKYKDIEVEFQTPVTWYVQPEDIPYLVKNGTQLYDRLKTLKESDAVQFSAQTIKDDNTGIKEGSFSMDGSLENPEFNIRLLNISKFGSTDVDLSKEKSNTVLDELPVKQKEFIELVESYYEKYSQASNELKKSSLRVDRKNKLRKLLPKLSVKNWIGIVKSTGTASSGDARLELTFPGSNIIIETMGGVFSDISSNTLIKNGSALYNKVSELEYGDKIYFSGTFLSDVHKEDKNYLYEVSITEEGSMMEPEFIFRFSSVKKY